jgi:hypothetical protein
MKKTIAVVTLFFLVQQTSAMDISIPATATQGAFKDFVKEAGYALSFNPMAPAEPLGVTGFDISVEVVGTDIEDTKEYWEMFVDDADVVSILPVPRLHVQKGLPNNIDVGAIYASVPDSNISLWGIELKWAILEGGVATPALAIRGSYSRLAGVDELDLDTMAADVLISKGVLMLTPYAGASVVRVSGKEKSGDVSLDSESATLFRLIGGVEFSPLPLLVINAELSLGEIMQYGIKAGLRF